MVMAIKAEWTKLRTAPGTFWLLLALVVSIVGLSALATAAAGRCPGIACPGETAKVSLTGVQLGQALVAILAVLALGTEYSTRMMHVTLAAMPRRITVLAAKAAVVTGLVLVAACVAVPACLLVSRLIMPGHGYPAPSLGDGPVLRAAGGSVLYLALIALLSLGIAAMVRDPAAAIGAVLALLYVFPIVAQVVSDAHWRRHLSQIGPMSAGLSIQATTHLRDLPIGPWAGLGVLAAWAAGALLAGGLLLRLRDA